MSFDLIRLLSAIDLLGVPIAINFSGKQKFRTHFGGICTLLFFAFVIWALYNASQDFFTTVNPTTISSEEYYDVPRELFLNSSTFPMAIGLLDPNLTAFHNESLFKARYVYRIHTRTLLPNGSFDEHWYYKNLTTERCRPDHFGELDWSFADLHLEHAYCMADHQPVLNDSDSRVRIKGASTSERYESLVILIQICNNATSDITCGTPEEQERMLGGSFFNIFYGNTAINLKNSSRPDQRFKDLYYAMLSPTTYREAIIDLGRIEVDTDSGWIVPTESVSQYIKLNKIVESLYPEPNWEDILMACVLGVSKLENHHKRSYKKIADVLAEVGGLANSVLLIILITTTSFFQLKFREKLVNEMFDISAYKKEETKLKRAITQAKLDKAAGKKKSNKDRGKSQSVSIKANKNASANKPKEEKAPPSINNESPTHRGLIQKTIQLTSPDHVEKANDEDGPISLNSLLQRVLSEEDVKKTEYGQKSKSHIPRAIIENRQNKYHESDVARKKKTKSYQGVRIEHPKASNDETPRNRKNSNEEEPLGKFGRKAVEEMRNDDLENPSFAYKPKEMKESIHFDSNEIEDLENKKGIDVTPTEKIGTPDPLSARSNPENGKPWSEDDVDDFDKPTSNETKKPDKIELSPWEYVCSFVYPTETIKYKLAVLSRGISNIDERLDVLNMLLKLREIDKLKAMLFDKDQITLFGHLPKPQLKPKEKESQQNGMSFHSNLLRKSTIKEGLETEVEIQKLLRQIRAKSKTSEIDERFLEIFNESRKKGFD